MSVIIFETETVALSRKFVVGNNRILPPPRLPYDWNSPVPERYQLGYSAGFRHGRHQKHIRSCVNFM